MVEEQAFPFEEKAIQVHEKNIELITAGVYSSWIDRSIEKLAGLLPARYAKPEESTNYIANIDNYIYSSPRFVREDASTGFIGNLDFFRYASQKAQVNYHKNQTKGDIGNNESVNQDQINVVSPEPAPVAEQANAEGSVSKSTVPAESSALKQGGTGEVEQVPSSEDTLSTSDAEVPEANAQEAQADKATESTEHIESDALSVSSAPDNGNEAPVLKKESTEDSNVAEKQEVKKQEIKKQSVDTSGNGKVQEQESGSIPSQNAGPDELNKQIVEADQ